MKLTRKLFKYGKDLAVIIPQKFVQHLLSDEVEIEFRIDDSKPTLAIDPIHELDSIKNPESLKGHQMFLPMK